MSNERVVAILGAGNGGFAHAADLAIKGFGVNLYEVPEFGENLAAVKERGGIELKVTGNPGMDPGFGPLRRVTTDVSEAVGDAGIVIIVVPAFAQRRFAQVCAPFLRDEHLVMLSPGNFGGCLEMWSALQESGSRARPLLCETECMTYSGFKSGPAEVEVSGYKEGHTLAAFPGRRTGEALERVRPLFPSMKGARNILETGLRNSNTVCHPPIMVLNAGRVEDTDGKFLFYWQGCTRGVGQVIERIEVERLQIGEALGLNLTPMRDVHLQWYAHSGASGDTLPDVLRTNPVYAIDWAPPRLQHRFLTEDIPFGMVPMERMGQYAGVPTPMTTAIIEMSCGLLGEDLRKKGRDLGAFGLAGMPIEELGRYLDEGARAE